MWLRSNCYYGQSRKRTPYSEFRLLTPGFYVRISPASPIEFALSQRTRFSTLITLADLLGPLKDTLPKLCYTKCAFDKHKKSAIL